MAQPDDEAPEGFRNRTLRESEPIDIWADHEFMVEMTDSWLKLRVDSCEASFRISELPKLLAPGPIRFYSSVSWMAVKK